MSNRIINGLRDGELAAWEPFLIRVPLEQHEELAGPDEPLEYVWFPQSGVISQVVETHDGRSVDVALIGAEGVVGLPALFGVRYAATRAIVQIAGSALRIAVDDLQRRALEEEHPLIQHLKHYAAVTHISLAQIAGCNRLHRANERLARWLLMVRDRIDGDTMPMTHEFLGLMVGTRRTAITETVQELQAAGCIAYERGSLTIIDARRLEEAACECYAVIKNLFVRTGVLPFGVPR